ncbi:MAG: ferritin-like domain-containing protein [Myxococcota bacterium]
MNPRSELRRLGRLLQLAYSGELGAIHAYLGHRRSLKDFGERLELRRILEDEIRHRRSLLRMLEQLGLAPEAYRERKLTLIGRTIGLLCRIGGWFVPMYGAGRLEAQNIVEYERAARLALLAGREEWVDELLTLAEVEWDHERYFREKAESHWAGRLVPFWPKPPPRARIRESFEAFRRAPTAVPAVFQPLTR